VNNDPENHEQRERRFDGALRRWGGRDPRTRPEAAATRVLAHLPSSAWRFVHRRALAVAAVAVLALIGLGWLALRNGGVPPSLPMTSQVAAMHIPTLDDNVVLWWVDPETPVYFVLTPPDRK
jgi:hypothetical protein